MYECTQLLIRASQTLGTVLGFANLLEVDPPLVYRWIAGFERPEPASVELFVMRLRAMHEAGGRYVRLRPVARTASAWKEMVEWIAADVLPSVRGISATL